jgi:hypothetical protein
LLIFHPFVSKSQFACSRAWNPTDHSDRLSPGLLNQRSSYSRMANRGCFNCGGSACRPHWNSYFSARLLENFSALFFFLSPHNARSLSFETKIFLLIMASLWDIFVPWKWAFSSSRSWSGTQFEPHSIHIRFSCFRPCKLQLLWFPLIFSIPVRLVNFVSHLW